mmetsp:Transcript_14485/g.28647  ORF Transcript_14485/g.28647 Transcript_14485/m.28647 type:complete len:271 (+) Transcript_14485:490-1302(+)
MILLILIVSLLGLLVSLGLSLSLCLSLRLCLSRLRFGSAAFRFRLSGPSLRLPLDPLILFSLAPGDGCRCFLFSLLSSLGCSPLCLLLLTQTLGLIACLFLSGSTLHRRLRLLSVSLCLLCRHARLLICRSLLARSLPGGCFGLRLLLRLLPGCRLRRLLCLPLLLLLPRLLRPLPRLPRNPLLLLPLRRSPCLLGLLALSRLPLPLCLLLGSLLLRPRRLSRQLPLDGVEGLLQLGDDLLEALDRLLQHLGEVAARQELARRLHYRTHV